MDKIMTQGPLAHLVERIHGMDEVAGSSPAWSTKKKNNFANTSVHIMQSMCFWVP